MQLSDWALFIGHFHPVIVHLPIGFLLIAGILEAGRWLGSISTSTETMSTILFWSAVSATLACGFGYLLSLGGGYEANTLQAHQWQGIGVAAFAWLAWFAKSGRADRLPAGSVLYVPALVLSLALVGTTGHLGGSLTHGTDYLTQYTPQPFRSWVGLPPRSEAVTKVKPISDVSQAMVYDQIINPILQSCCIQCHNPQKIKGGLRYDTAEMLKKGGEHGPAFVAGNGANSRMVKYCLLPNDDELHMPPKGKPQLTEQQITLLTWWINEGAPFDKKVADLKPTEAVRPALAALGTGVPTTTQPARQATGPAPDPVVLTMTVSPADVKAVAALQKISLLVLPISKDKNQLEISAVNAATFSDVQAVLLTPIHDQIVWLKLGDTAIGDATLAQIAKLPNLQKLHLEQTHITDAGVHQLVGLKNLEYLNLYGTSITDASLRDLANLKSLRTVCVWQTKTTEAGITTLRKARPDLEIIGGMVQ